MDDEINFVCVSNSFTEQSNNNITLDIDLRWISKLFDEMNLLHALLVTHGWFVAVVICDEIEGFNHF